MTNFISFIVPAHNEAYEIGKSLESIFAAARAVGTPFELIVVNDASTDNTADLARAAGARVVDVELRKISAVRNAGARLAKGDVLFFIDADTRISEAVLRAALKALASGAVGGGAWVKFAEPMPWWVQPTLLLFNIGYMGILHWAAGCFIFAKKDAFQAAGMFDESLFASEEIFLSQALKRQGRFVIVRESVHTSGRKLRFHSLWVIFPFLFRLLRRGPAMLRGREGMDWWYDGKREK